MNSIRDLYDEHGVADYYRLYGAEYRNPHEPTVKACIAQAIDLWSPNLDFVLDLACGSGEVTMAIRDRLGLNPIHPHAWWWACMPKPNISGADPYTYTAYEQRTGCYVQPLSFDDIINHKLTTYFTTIFCSFALHLVEESKLPRLCWHLARSSPRLIVITPHKRPILKKEWGYRLVDEFKIERIRTRLYKAPNSF